MVSKIVRPPHTKVVHKPELRRPTPSRGMEKAELVVGCIGNDVDLRKAGLSFI